eukprot:6191334-Pleurochrysis_carterae.AAC.1
MPITCLSGSSLQQSLPPMPTQAAPRPWCSCAGSRGKHRTHRCATRFRGCSRRARSCWSASCRLMRRGGLREGHSCASALRSCHHAATATATATTTATATMATSIATATGACSERSQRSRATTSESAI